MFDDEYRYPIVRKQKVLYLNEYTASELYCSYVEENYIDINVIDYEDNCQFSEILSRELLLPFREDFIFSVDCLYLDDRLQQIQYLYRLYNNLSDEEHTVSYEILVRLYLTLMEEYGLPYDMYLSIKDWDGNMDVMIKERV